MSTMVVNRTTGEGKVFNLDNQSYQFNNFLRKAVLDWLYGQYDTIAIRLPNGKDLVVSAGDPEPVIWFGAAVLYMKCAESGNWTDIVDIYEVSDDEEEDE